MKGRKMTTKEKLEKFIYEHYYKRDGTADTMHAACRDAITDILHVHAALPERDKAGVIDKSEGQLVRNALAVFKREQKDEKAKQK